MPNHTPETALKKNIKKTLGNIGAYWFSISPAFAKCPRCGMGFTRHGMRPGLPDIIACYQGKFFGIEAKAPRGVQSQYQKHEEAWIQTSGGIYILAYNCTDILTGIGIPTLFQNTA